MCINQFAGTIGDPLRNALLAFAVVLKVLVLYVITSPHNKDIGLRELGKMGEVRRGGRERRGEGEERRERRGRRGRGEGEERERRERMKEPCQH